MIEIKRPLTERRIRDSIPGPKTFILWDQQVKGLGLRVTPAGAKSFILDYRVDGRKRRATLARANEVSLKEIRLRAGNELVAIRNGETDPLTRRKQTREAPTVNDGLDRFFAEFVPERMRIGRLSRNTITVYRHQANKYLRPGIGKNKIQAITRHDVERMVAPLPPMQRNRTLAFVSRLFNLFEEWELRPQNSNPAKRIERTREEPRDRTLAPSELAALSTALAEIENQYPAPVAAIRFATITGLRIGEVLAVQWDHVEFETGRLTLPETKTGRRTHDLPTVALELLTAQPRFFANGVCLFMRTWGANVQARPKRLFQSLCKCRSRQCPAS